MIKKLIKIIIGTIAIITLLFLINKNSYKNNSILKNSIFENEINNKLQIEIQNGCGERGVADLYTNFLRNSNYDVINYKNAQNFDFVNTKILVHKENLDIADLINILAIDPLQVEYIFDNKIFFDATLIIGEDFKNLKSFNDVLLYISPFN